MDNENDSRSSPAGEAQPDKVEESKPAPPVENLAKRVRQQRQHIEGLTGQDPLRAGIDD
ncbi:hypothetical protein [Phenylobacterium sp.]|uniref:hypothetical protein n=1 Tax=Phenylobacterium sp. TaxID=1871053 RepID=UPI00272F9CA3|nr:hypothetical protein [Phenylobacterium sp.]MDP1872562.1 hypothetical protein [Phenylobacterium sp.]